MGVERFAQVTRVVPPDKDAAPRDPHSGTTVDAGTISVKCSISAAQEIRETETALASE